MLQFSQSLEFNLSDSLSCDVEMFAYVFESFGFVVVKAEPHYEHLSLSLVEVLKRLVNVNLEVFFS